MGAKKIKRNIYVSKRETRKNILSGLLTTLTIMAAGACVVVAILLTIGHRSTAEGGTLYALLPTFSQNTESHSTPVVQVLHDDVSLPPQIIADNGTMANGIMENGSSDSNVLAGSQETYFYEPFYEPYEHIPTSTIPLQHEQLGEPVEYAHAPEQYHEHEHIAAHLDYAAMLYNFLTDEPYEYLPYVPIPQFPPQEPVHQTYEPEDYSHYEYNEHAEQLELPQEEPRLFAPPRSRQYPANTPFHAFSFYIPENAHNYEYFHHNNPELSTKEVVWKVNAHLHLPFYTYIYTNYDPNPLLVNPSYRLPPGFRPDNLVPVNSADCNLRGTPEAVEAFRAMRATARADGFDLSITSAFRTAERQRQLFSNRNYVDGVIARPYHSEHQTGRALDLWGPGGLLDARGPSATGRWVAANAHNYGFIIRYGASTTHITGFIHEPWHITYVGRYISMYMYYNDILSLEEFVGRHPGATLGWTFYHLTSYSPSMNTQGLGSY